jgi:hypothetical protein
MTTLVVRPISRGAAEQLLEGKPRHPVIVITANASMPPNALIFLFNAVLIPLAMAHALGIFLQALSIAQPNL